MNVVIINKSDRRGGAAVVSYRLMEALRSRGVNAQMLVCEKLTDSPFVHPAAPEWKIKIAFLKDRLSIFLHKGVNRENLFKVDTAEYGLPLHRHPLVREADVICLNWVNQGMLSLKGLLKLRQLGKPVIWTMHDMWCFTGICHHAGSCRRYTMDCGECPHLGKGASVKDFSFSTLKKKVIQYNSLEKPMHFVAVSNWLADLARESTLLRPMPVLVIPNAFPLPEPAKEADKRQPGGDKFKVLFGAARLDDPIKGLPILVEATRILSREYPAVAGRLELVTFGNVKNPAAFEGIGISHRHLGMLHGEQAIKAAYEDADAVVSTSLYETLPGTLVEGQAYGCVPVAFDRGGQRDIVTHLDTGYLVEWSDDIEQAATNIAAGIVWASKQRREEIKERMYKSVKQRFEASNVADKYIELFKKLM